MKPYRGAVAAFVILGLLLFGVGLFLIGDKHKAFNHHLDFYADLANVNGMIRGTHVRVNGFDAGQVSQIDIPQHPRGRFHLKLHVDDKLRNLIRTDSIVTVETDGLVGDKFLLIHSGSDNAQLMQAGGTIPTKEPIELSAIIEKVNGTIDKVNGTIDQANTTIVDVRGRLDGTLDSITRTVNNTNGIVTGIRQGHGPVGALLNDPQITSDLKGTVANTRQATDNLNQVSVQAGQVMSDFQSRNMIAKADQSVDNIRHATEQLDQVSQQVNTNLTQAFAPDASGRSAGENLQGTLSNVNTATSNMAEDTEALKHEFFFKGFFKKRGFYSLDDLTPEEYRANTFFETQTRSREWLDGTSAFATDSGGHQMLTDAGKRQIDGLAGSQSGSLVRTPIIVEGYANNPDAVADLLQAKERAVLVKRYLEQRLKLEPKNIGVMPLQSTPPQTAGKSSFDGACIVLLKKPK